MADKLKEFRAGREAGIEMALKEVRQNGREGLEKLVRFYGKSGISPVLAQKDLDIQTEFIKEVTIKTLLIGAISILHDDFGFGTKRLRKFADGYNHLANYLAAGWVTWFDLIEEIKSRLGIDIVFESGHYRLKEIWQTSDPDPEPQPDKDWIEVLASLGLTEVENPPGSNCFDITDGEYLYRYENPEEKERLLYWFWGRLDERKMNNG